LWAAVIRRAAVDWVLYRGHSTTKLNKLGEDAHSWIFVEEDDDLRDQSSFASVCASLNIEVAAMRFKISSVTEEDARRLRGLDFDDEE
jgi:DNA-binding FadR family transcriptional regulator